MEDNKEATQMKFASCEIPLFGRHVLAVIDCSEEEALKHFTKYCEKEGDGAFAGLVVVNTATGWCQVQKGDVYIWSKESYAILYHEMVHAAFALCREVDMCIDEEMIARLVQYMKLNIVDELKEVE